MEECRKRKLNQKARILFATKSGISGLSSGISGHPNPDYPDSHPEYPVTLVMFRTVPTPSAGI
jgi:hypothetical protein